MKPSKALTINKHEVQLRVYWGLLGDTDDSIITEDNSEPSHDVKTAIGLVHEIGHIAEDRANRRIRTKENDMKTVGFENKARKILGLKERQGNMQGSKGNQCKAEPTNKN